MQPLMAAPYTAPPSQVVLDPAAQAKFGAWVENHTPFMKNEFIQPWMITVADDHYDLDISRAKQVLNWSPRHALDKTLPMMINSLKHHPIAWYKKNGLHMPESLKKRILEERLVNK